MKSWEKTDEMQWVRNDEEGKYTVVIVDISIYDKEYMVHQVEVNLSEYTNEQLDEVVRCAYHSLEDLKEDCPQTWKQIIAELIAENAESVCEFEERFEEMEDVHDHLKNAYGIEIEQSDNIV